jgi:hypothetical protein
MEPFFKKVNEAMGYSFYSRTYDSNNPTLFNDFKF